MINYRFTADWCGWLQKSWKDLLSDYKGRDNLTFLEIGSYEGRSSLFWCDEILTGENSILVCIDPWKTNNAECNFDHNTLPLQETKKLIKIKDRSENYVSKFDDGFFDFIYIDGWHKSFAVLRDGVNYFSKLKNGGIMLFDDYEWTNPDYKENQLPKVGIDMFLEVYKDKIDIIYKKYQVAIRKKKNENE